MSCCVPGCSNKKTEKNKFEISFHSIPKAPPEIRAKWLEAIGRPGWEAYKATVCSAHFKDTDLGDNYGTAQRRTIPKTSIPCLNLPSQKGIDVASLNLDALEERVPRKRKATPRYSSDIYELDDPEELAPNKKIKLSTNQYPRSGEQKKLRVIDNWMGICKPNEKPTQTSTEDWKSSYPPSNKQVQADLSLQEERFWYMMGGLETKKVDDFHCSSAADHRTRYRIDVLYNELHRLKSMKHDQDRLIEYLQSVLRPSSIMDRRAREPRTVSIIKEQPPAPASPPKTPKQQPEASAPPEQPDTPAETGGGDAGGSVVDEVAEMLAQLHGEGVQEEKQQDSTLSVVYVNNMGIQMTSPKTLL
jgi:hypothetical protein